MYDNIMRPIHYMQWKYLFVLGCIVMTVSTEYKGFNPGMP